MFEDILSSNPIVDAIMQVEDFPEELEDFLHHSYFKKRDSQKASQGRSVFLDEKKGAKYIQRLTESLNQNKGLLKTICSQKIPLQVSFQIYNNKVAIYSTDKEDISGIIIENKKIYDTFLGIFNFIWATI